MFHLSFIHTIFILRMYWTEKRKQKGQFFVPDSHDRYTESFKFSKNHWKKNILFFRRTCSPFTTIEEKRLWQKNKKRLWKYVNFILRTHIVKVINFRTIFNEKRWALIGQQNNGVLNETSDWTIKQEWFK